MAVKLRVFSACVLLFCCAACLTPASEAATEYNRYLAHIFQKYGNGGTMTFEGLEHLMYSLGLGQIEFEPSHTVDEHRMMGFENAKPKNEQEMKTYFEQQVIQLLSNEDSDVQVPNGIVERKEKKDLHAAAEVRDTVPEAHIEDAREKFVLEFKEMHDPKHRHPRENDATFTSPPLSSNVCLSPKSLLRLVFDHDDLHKRKLHKTLALATPNRDAIHNFEEEYNEFVNNVKLTPVAFMKLCPALLAQIDQHVCVRPAPLTHGEDPKELLWNAWIYASASIFILSASGLLGILLVPLMKSVAYQEILKFLVAVAVGTLSGDALMHLLPHALVSEHGAAEPEQAMHTEGKHSHNNEAVWICACAFATAVFMYILENLLPLLRGESGSSAGHGHSHGGGHGHSHNASQPPLPATNTNEGGANALALPPPTADLRIGSGELNVMLNELKKDQKTPSRPLTPVAFMVVIGDGLHNLTDGLAIGAAFATDPVTGMATAFAVLCHELPHELGDFALLLQTGVSMRRAICLNIVSSVLSFVGMAVGLLIAGLHSSMTQWIYAGTAGSFLYIAFADLIPAMGGEGKRDLKGTLIQILGVIVGGLIMLVIAVNEDDLELLFE